jgi:putative addiction module CopG family antidote
LEKWVGTAALNGFVSDKGEANFMQLKIPPDLQPLVDKRLSSGEYGSAEEVFRRALEALEAEETWTEEERRALDQKIDHALAQAAAGNLYGPDEARRKLAAMREAHLSDLGR